jgi:hypothetical protein
VEADLDDADAPGPGHRAVEQRPTQTATTVAPTDGQRQQRDVFEASWVQAVQFEPGADPVAKRRDQHQRTARIAPPQLPLQRAHAGWTVTDEPAPLTVDLVLQVSEGLRIGGAGAAQLRPR